MLVSIGYSPMIGVELGAARCGNEIPPWQSLSYDPGRTQSKRVASRHPETDIRNFPLLRGDALEAPSVYLPLHDVTQDCWSYLFVTNP